MSAARSRRRPLDECFQQQDDGTVLCLICETSCLYESTRNHLKGVGHLFKVANNAAAAQRSLAGDTAYNALFNDSAALELNAPPPDRLSESPEPVGETATDPGLLVDVEMELDSYASAYADAHALPTPQEYLDLQAAGLEQLSVNLALMYMQDDMLPATEDATIPDQPGSGDHESDDEEGECTEEEVRDAQRGRWAPYPNKTIFYLILLDAFARLRLSDAQMRAFLWTMKKCNARDVPSLHMLRKWQRHLRKSCGTATEGHRSTVGNVFYSNNICGTIAMDFAKPAVACAMRHYPEISSKGISEIRHAGRWGEMDLDSLTPMYSDGREHFYVNELCSLKSGQFFVPKLWHLRDDVLHASGYKCQTTQRGALHVLSDEFVLVPASMFESSFPTLVAQGRLPNFDESSEGVRRSMPNRLRALAEGSELYSVFLNIFGDDVSGNVSKQYNKHNNVYIANVNLPSSMLSQEAFLHFFSTSPHASTGEQFSALKSQMNETHTRPFPAYNAATNRPCKFRLFPFAFPADNPQQSDECSCALGQATCNCRKCHNRRRPPAGAGDTNLDWYTKNFSPGEPRTAAETLAELNTQVSLALTDGITAVKKAQTNSGIKDRLTEYWIAQLLQQAKDLKAKNRNITKEQLADQLQSWLRDQPGDKQNVLLDWMGLDPHRDTPVEILHTVLLGIVKYMWHSLHTSWTSTPQKAELFVIRLQASDIRGLNIPPLRAAYMMQYKNGLIGKHFKSIGQLAAFHVHDLTTEAQYRLVKAIGALLPVLWYPLIKNMDSYLAELQVLIDNVLAAFAIIDPLRILEKVKIHILVHLVDDIRRFGPAVRFATEIFECFNAVFRMCSVLSNHLAPSRDIAIALADMERVKHIVSGGYWFDGSEWVQAGEKVREALREHRIVQQQLGFSPKSEFTPGMVKRVAVKKQVHRPFPADDLALLRTPNEKIEVQQTTWSSALSVTSKTGDVCAIDSWIAVQDDQPFVGRIVDILVPLDSTPLQPRIKVERYTLGTALHPTLEMPVLRYEKTLLVLPACVLFSINVQHDCIAAKCTGSGTRVVRQERQDSGITVPAWAHTATRRYVINMHAIHNAMELRELLPRALIYPKPIWSDKDQELLECSRSALQKYLDKEKGRKEKAAETRRKNKEKQNTALQNPHNVGAGGDDGVGQEEEGGHSGTEELDGAAEEPERDDAGRLKRRRVPER